jgi:hypothetical protein
MIQRQSAHAVFNAQDNSTSINLFVPGVRTLHVDRLGLVPLHTDTTQGGLSVSY